MANTFNPFGFQEFGRQEGGSPTAGMDRFFINSSDASVYFTGDLVCVSSRTPGVLSLFDPSSGAIPMGVFVGCEYYSASFGRVTWNNYFPGSVGSSSPVTAYVITDPERLFIAQGSTAAVLGTSVIGFGISVLSSAQASGDTLNGRSCIGLGSSACSQQSATSPFVVVDVYQNYAPPGVNGTSSGSEAAQIMVVRPNRWARKSLNMAST